jgi:predicted phage tail protein
MGNSIPSNSFSKLVDVAPGAPTINSVNVSSGQATVAFTEGTNNGSQISSYQYSKDNGSTWVSVGTSTSITLTTGLTNGTSYDFRVRAVNAMGPGADSNLLNKMVRPTLPEAKTQNTLKATYATYGYQLQDLVNSALYTLIELKQIGYVLSELKAFFTTDDLIRTWSFSGSELKQEGLIESGITFIYLVIVFNGVFSVNRTYSSNNTNKEDTYYNVVFEGQYSQNKLTSISI